MPRSRARFYGGGRDRPSRDGERQAELDLAGAAALDGLAAEIELLRALVKRAIQLDNTEEARRLVVVLCGALRLQHNLAGTPRDELARMLDEVYAEVGLEHPAPSGEAGGER